LSKRDTLAAVLRSSIARSLPEGWLYLPKRELQASTECIFIGDEEYDSDDLEAAAAALGFPNEGLDKHDLEAVCSSAIALDANASDALLVRAFVYYLRFDAFLPSIGASDPPPRDQVLLGLDREFYESLGQEAEGTFCRREGCERGSVYLSAFCRKHHFENVRKRPCPFE
jgi:hypothetical protein